jgi:glutathione S-transferase
MTELLGLPYSPWTEKARWALDVRRVPYTFRHYQPLVGEPALRVKLGRLRGRVTVPVLTTDDGGVLADSMDIARWSDGRGEGPRLFPAEHEAAVAGFVALSDRALAAGRAGSLSRMLSDEEALSEVVPRPLRGALGGLAVRIARLGIARTRRKYGGDQAGAEGHRQALIGALDEIRAALARAPAPSAPGGPRTLLGSLTFADIAVAQALVSAEPPASGLRMGPASRRCFMEPGLRERYADLVAWRDDLYRAYRTAPEAPPRG